MSESNQAHSFNDDRFWLENELNKAKGFLRENFIPELHSEFGKGGMNLLQETKTAVCGPNDVRLPEGDSWEINLAISRDEFQSQLMKGIKSEIRKRLKFRVITFFTRFDYTFVDVAPYFEGCRPFNHLGEIETDFAIHKSEILSFYIFKHHLGRIRRREEETRTAKSLFRGAHQILQGMWYHCENRDSIAKIHHNPAAWIGQRLHGDQVQFLQWLTSNAGFNLDKAEWLGSHFESLSKEYLQYGTLAHSVPEYAIEELNDYYRNSFLPIPFLDRKEYQIILKFIAEVVADPITWLSHPSNNNSTGMVNDWLIHIDGLAEGSIKKIMFNMNGVIDFGKYLAGRARAVSGGL